MRTRLTPTARDLLRSLRDAGPGGVAEHRFFSATSTTREADAVARALLDLEARGLIRQLKGEDPSPGAREAVWVLARKDPTTGPSPAPWAVSSEKGAFYIHPDGSPGILAKVYRRRDARLIRSAPELREAVRALLSLAPEGGDLSDNGELSGAAVCDMARAVLRKVARGPP